MKVEANEVQESPVRANSHTEAEQTPRATNERGEGLRWWLKLVLQPMLFLVCGALVVVGLGVAQKQGWISARGRGEFTQASTAVEKVQYVCPMMCTPPRSEPGRCPVCAMELVPVNAAGGRGDPLSVRIDPAARRVANIQTVAVRAAPWTRTVRGVGELCYDEGGLKSISAYVNGRLDRLYADYTGVVVRKGDHLALLYSPELYSGQVELLLARKAQTGGPSREARGGASSISNLYASARQKLIELGMTEGQIEELEKTGVANSRMHLCAPISGTVIAKKAVEGQYVKEGQAIYELADLSTVWLMLRLFPEDAATVRYGQTVSAEVQSLPGRRFTGRVAFIDPTVDRKTRTVGVRVVLPNEHGLLRVGDYAKATIEVPVSKSGDAAGPIYDPALANKWISPRHPHVIESSPGKCRICGIDLVPASRLGFTDKPIPSRTALFVPRDAVLMAGANSVVYVETESGRFQIRKVVVGPSDGDQIVILKGVKEGEEVASSGNFLIDSQMQLTGNPSLIDPVKAGRASDDSIPTPADLSPADRALAEKQRFCPVTDAPLGSMGVPRKVDVNGTPVFICCEGCRKRLLEEPERYLAKLTTDPGEEKEQREVAQVPVPPIAPVTPLARESDLPRTESPCLADDDAKEIAEALAKLSPADRRLAERQRVCPVADVPLGSMGVPIKVTVRGTPVFICCEGCRNRLLASPEQYLAKVRGGEER